MTRLLVIGANRPIVFCTFRNCFVCTNVIYNAPYAKHDNMKENLKTFMWYTDDLWRKVWKRDGEMGGRDMGKGTSDPSQFLLVFFHTHDLHIYIVHAYKKKTTLTKYIPPFLCWILAERGFPTANWIWWRRYIETREFNAVCSNTAVHCRFRGVLNWSNRKHVIPFWMAFSFDCNPSNKLYSIITRSHKILSGLRVLYSVIGLVEWG